MFCGFNQGQKLGQDGGIGVSLEAFSSLQIDSCNEDGAVGGLPQESLKSTSLLGVGCNWGQPAGLVTKNEDATGVASAFLVDLCRCSKGYSSSYAEILANLLVTLRVKVGLYKNAHLALPGPEPVQKLLAKGGDVGKVQLAMFLFETLSLLWARM